jgi:fructose-1-phosphate kinase PfkB-like protein
MTRIVTLTLNPAVDLACLADGVVSTHKIRTFDEHIDPGGGGINVARVLKALGADVRAIVLAGGVTGALIEEMLTDAGVPHETIHCRASASPCSTAPRSRNIVSCLWGRPPSHATGITF